MSRKKTVKTVNKIFAQNIQKLIDDRCAGNKREFGASIGVEYDTVRSWCIGEYLPGGSQLLQIREIYDISIDNLLCGIQEKNTPVSEWPEDIKNACLKLKEIMEYNDGQINTSVQSHLTAGIRAIEKNKKVDVLSERLNNQEKEINSLKKSIHGLLSATDQKQHGKKGTGI